MLITGEAGRAKGIIWEFSTLSAPPKTALKNNVCWYEKKKDKKKETLKS